MTKVPRNISFFLWAASLGKILTTDNLWKRHLLIVDWCYTYKQGIYFSPAILLFFCKRHMVICICIVWASPGDAQICAWSFGVLPQGGFHQHWVANVWQAMPLCIIWNLLYERNKRIFDGGEHPILRCMDTPFLFMYRYPIRIISDTSKMNYQYSFLFFYFFKCQYVQNMPMIWLGYCCNPILNSER